MCDIDHFKSINDRYGHDFGDVALVRIAAIIYAVLGCGAIIGRQGGEEFAILFPDCDSSRGQASPRRCGRPARRLAVRLRRRRSPLTLSFGVAAAERRSRDFRLLLSRADAALYQAKRDGRNRVVWATERRRFTAA